MSGFLFDGRSRPNRMQLARDTHKSKEKLIDEAHQRQLKRDEERRRGRAAGRIQRAVRVFLAKQQLLRLALDVFTKLPTGEENEATAPQLQQQPSPLLTPRQLGTVSWCFQYCRRHERIIPVALLAEPPQGTLTMPTSPSSGPCTSTTINAVIRATRARALVRQCSGKLVGCIRQILQHQRRAGSGGFQTMLSELSPHAVGFLVVVLLEDYTASLAENNGSLAEKAYRGLDELCKAATVSCDGAANTTVLVETIVCSCLTFCATRMPHAQTARNRLLGLLSPLVPLCAPGVAIRAVPADPASPSPNEEEETGGKTAHAQDTAAAAEAEGDAQQYSLGTGYSLWSDACWACLTSVNDDSYMSLTSNPVAALLSAEEAPSSTTALINGADSGDKRIGARATQASITAMLMVLQVAYEKIILDSFMDGPAPRAGTEGTGTIADASPASSASTTSSRWWEPPAMAVLGRLTRLLPLFLNDSDDATGPNSSSRDSQLARAAWLRCIGGLCERLCQREAFTHSILFDLHHSRLQLMEQRSGERGPRKTPQPHAAKDVAAAAAGAHRGGKYRSLSSHLFSSEGGLKLMEQLATAAATAAATTTAATSPHGSCEEKAEANQASDSTAAASDKCAVPQLHYLPAEEEQQLLSLNVLEAVCGVYAWPLFTFSLASPQNRLESSAVFAKLVHTPQLLRQLWCLYRSRCEGLAALLPPGELLETLCTIALKPNVAVRMPFWLQPPASLLAEKGLRGRLGMFWDPNPAFAAFFFTLLGYYVDVTDFAQELQRETVLTQKESWALILALKEIVHRAHFHGVVPGTNGEAVAHLAYILLAKLHVINESSAFVPYQSLWISTTDEGTMRALGSITPEQWESLSEKLVQEQRRLERKMDGTGDEEEDEMDKGSESDSSGGAEENDPLRNRSNRLTVVPQFLSTKYNRDKAKAAAAVAALRRQRFPGNDITFEESTSWPLEERVARLLMHTPFMIPFPQRAALLTMFLLRTQPPRMPGRPTFFVVHRGRTFVDTFERFHGNPNSADMYSVRFAAARAADDAAQQIGGRHGSGGDGGGRGRTSGLVSRIRNALEAHILPDGNEEDEDEMHDDVEGNAGWGAFPPRLRRQQQQRQRASEEDSDEDRLQQQHEGLEEGYGQGVYRELLVSVCREGFDASYGLFQQTEDGFVYPNPFSFEATGDPLHLLKISFLGTMVGRAFRDGILQDCAFALHFRNALLGRRNSINNLRSFDAQLYQQLISLSKMSKEEIEGMCLTFTYDINALGVTKEVELIRGGAHVQVTQSNCLHYIQLVADFKLNREGAQQMQAFKAGLEAVILPSWLQLFDSNELLNLLGGDQTGKIDIKDWRDHTTYQPPEAEHSQSVKMFWDVVLSLTSEQQHKLLKFATSMNRPPLLGFRFLSPQFNIHMLPDAAVNRLPTASTCFSMLKLPPYRDYASARAKIIAAIEETSSFGLT